MPRHDIWAIGRLDNSHFIFKMKKSERTKKMPCCVAYNVKTGEASIFGGKDGIDGLMPIFVEFIQTLLFPGMQLSLTDSINFL